MSLNAVQIEYNVLPKNPGEFSIQTKGIYRPPRGKRVEIFMMTPHGRVGALIPECHKWSFDGEGKLSVSPSIVYFDYHGFLQNGVWS